MLGLPEVFTLTAVLVQLAVVFAIVYGGFRLANRYGVGQRPADAPPRNPLDL